MATKNEEKRAFKRLCKADISGDHHEDRVLSVEYRNYEDSPKYRAYISGFGAGINSWYGWSYASDPLDAVNECIKRAEEVLCQTENIPQ